MEHFPQPNNNRNEQTIKRLLGLRDFPQKTPKEKQTILGSEARVRALDAISTSTLPLKKKEVKKGIVLELAEKGLISIEVLRNHPLVYLGSGTDIKYSLALGGRVILMVDPILKDEEIQKEVIAKIQKIVGENIKITEKTLVFKFDFGEGEEDVRVELVTKPYPSNEEMRTEEDFDIPENAGLIVLYASQGPDGSIRVSDSMREKLASDGAIIYEHQLIPKEGAILEMGN